MKPKPKSLQYFNRARRIPRKIVKLELELKTLELATNIKLEGEAVVPNDTKLFQNNIERSKQRIRSRIDVLRDRFRELETLGFASTAIFLLSLV